MERIYLSILVVLACIACTPQNPPEVLDMSNVYMEEDSTLHEHTSVYHDDSTFWCIYIAYTDIYASDQHIVEAPFHIPTREEAKVLKNITFGREGVRYLTNDGYTFGMPGKSITKAGAKTKYSVIALYRRKYIIRQDF